MWQISEDNFTEDNVTLFTAYSIQIAFISSLTQSQPDTEIVILLS